MSDSTVATEQFKEVSNKEKDEKKVKKKKSVKSSEGKSKSTSRKSSAAAAVENGESTTVENGNTASEISPKVNGSSGEEQSPNNETLEKKLESETGSSASVDGGEKKEEKNVIMLREVDFRTLAELKEAFHLFDINRDGYIDKQDLKFTFTSIGKPDVTDEALEQMLTEMSSGEVDFDDFVKLFGYKSVELDPEEELLTALSKWDYQGNGMISEEILKRDLQSWGDKFSKVEAERAFEAAPLYKKDGMTMVDYVKFCHDICGLRDIERIRRIEKEAEAYDKDLASFVK